MPAGCSYNPERERCANSLLPHLAPWGHSLQRRPSLPYGGYCGGTWEQKVLCRQARGCMLSAEGAGRSREASLPVPALFPGTRTDPTRCPGMCPRHSSGQLPGGFCSHTSGGLPGGSTGMAASCPASSNPPRPAARGASCLPAGLWHSVNSTAQWASVTPAPWRAASPSGGVAAVSLGHLPRPWTAAVPHRCHSCCVLQRSLTRRTD